MERVFEGFVGGYIKRNAHKLGLRGSDVHLQRPQGYLLREVGGGRRFRLIPDVVIDGPDGSPAIVIDAKWKRLTPADADPRQGVAQSDLYQLFAYAARIKAPLNVLVYPRVAGAEGRTYQVEDEGGRLLRVTPVDVGGGSHVMGTRADLHAAIAGCGGARSCVAVTRSAGGHGDRARLGEGPSQGHELPQGMST